MKDNNLDRLIEQLICENKIDKLVVDIEESIDIDPNIKIVPSKIQSKGKELYDVDVNDKQYELSVDEFILPAKKSAIEFNFRLKNYEKLKQKSVSNYGIETGITGTGDAKEVFNKIVSTAVVLINKKSPNYITFQAREEKRQRLYKVMIKQILRKMGGYKLSNISPFTNNIYDESEFWLEKI